MTRFNWDKKEHCDQCNAMRSLTHVHSAGFKTEVVDTYEEETPRLPPGWSRLSQDDIESALQETAPLRYLETTQDDIAELAELVQLALTSQGHYDAARRAEAIGHRWSYKKSLREGMDPSTNTSKVDPTQI